MDGPTIYRPLSVTERIFNRNSRYGGMNTLVMLQLAGFVDEGRLDAALDALVARRPLMRSSIGAGTAGEPAFIVDAGGRPLLRIDTVTSDAGIDALVVEESRRDFAAHPRPWNLRLMRCTHRKRRSLLLLSCDHSLVDGQTKFLFFDELLRIYAAPRRAATLPPVEPPGPPLESDFDRQLTGVAIARYLIGESLRGLMPRPSLPLEGRAPGAARQSRFVHRTLPAELLPRLRERCRAADTTVHHAFLAALLFAWASIDPHRREVDSSSNINLRAAYPAREREWGVFVTVLAQRHRLAPDTSFWGLAAGNRADMTARLARGEHRQAALIMDWLLARESFHNFRLGLRDGDRQGRLATVSLSNMGTPPIAKRYGALTVEDVRAFGAQQAFGNLITYYFVTFGERAGYTTATVAPLIGAATETMLAQRFEQALGLAAAGDLSLQQFVARAR